MKISEEALQKIIKDEINEIFGLGKKKKKEVKEYPASELSTIIKALDDASRMSGAKLTPEQREAIVDELTSILRAGDFVVKENERLFLGDDYGDFLISSETTPKLNALLKTIARKNPKVFGQLQKVLKRGAFEINPREKYGTTGSDDQAQASQSDKEDIDISDIPGSDSALAASADAISSAAQKSPKSTPPSSAAPGSLEQTIQTISRKDDGRLKAFLRLAQAGGFGTKALVAMANQFGVKGSDLVSNLPRTEDLPQDIQRIVKTSSGRPHIATFIRDEVKRLFKAYSKNPQLIVSKAAPTDQQAAKPSEPETPPGASAPASGLKNLKPGEVMVALNQLGLRQGTIERAAKKALANRRLTKADRENIEAVTKQLISYLEGGLKESKIIVGPAAMRMIEELYENRWKEIAGIK